MHKLSNKTSVGSNEYYIKMVDQPNLRKEDTLLKIKNHCYFKCNIFVGFVGFEVCLSLYLSSLLKVSGILGTRIVGIAPCAICE